MQYVVRRAFTYAGRDFLQGETWEPAGHRNDAVIIRAGIVFAPKGAGSTAPAPTSEAESAPRVRAIRARGGAEVSS